MTVSNETAEEHRRAAVYRLYDGEGTLLYIGSAYDPEDRCCAHRAKPWWPEVARRTDEWFVGRTTAYAEELKAIAKEDPKHNLMGTARYTTPDTPGIRRRNEQSRLRGRVQSEAWKLWDETHTALQSEGVPSSEAFSAAYAARFAFIEESGLFPGWVARNRERYTA